MNLSPLCRKSKKDRIDKQLYIRLSSKELALVEAYAYTELRSRASFLRMLVMQAMYEYAKQGSLPASLPAREVLQASPANDKAKP